MWHRLKTSQFHMVKCLNNTLNTVHFKHSKRPLYAPADMAKMLARHASIYNEMSQVKVFALSITFQEVYFGLIVIILLKYFNHAGCY